MLKPEYSLFLGKTSETVFSGFVTENNLFLIVEIEGGTNESGAHFLSLIKEQMQRAAVSSLAQFESLITSSIKKANLSLGVSVAASYVHNDIAYLMTLGEGTIFLKRETEFAPIIHGNSNASGPVVKDDLYVLATKRFVGLFSSQEQLKKITVKNDVFTVVDAIYEEITDKEDVGITALFFSPLEVPQDMDVRDNEAVTVEEGASSSILSVKKSNGIKFPFRVPEGNSKRVLTVIAVAVIFIILIWSVVLGYGRRAEAELNKKVETTKVQVASQLGEAEAVHVSNPSHSLELIAEARREVQQLKDLSKGKKMEEVAALEKLITEKEGQITRKSEKTAEEFYDLSIDMKGATAAQLFVDGEVAVLPDKARKTAYLLSLSKKSLDKRIANEVGQASLFAHYEDNVYLFIKDKGIFTLSAGNRVKKIIDSDKDWGDVTALQIYNGNIYLLDSGKNDILKYLVAENGYSAKQSYFKANVDVRAANSLAIDSALYVGLPDDVVKYNGGLPTDFKTTYPDGAVSIEKIYTNDELQKVYVWDKENGKVYILGKTGEYDQQITSSIIKTATDFSVSGENLYFLSGSKLYSVHL